MDALAKRGLGEPRMPRSNRCWSSRISFQNASPSVGSRVDSHAAHSLSSITIKSTSVLLRPLCSAMARSGWGLRAINTSAAPSRCPRSAPCAYSPSARSNAFNRRQPQASIQSLGVVVVRALSLAAVLGFVRKVLRRAVCSISTRKQPIERSSSSSQSHDADRSALDASAKDVDAERVPCSRSQRASSADISTAKMVLIDVFIRLASSSSPKCACSRAKAACASMQALARRSANARAGASSGGNRGVPPLMNCRRPSS